jgi:hypothetical protein
LIGRDGLTLLIPASKIAFALLLILYEINMIVIVQNIRDCFEPSIDLG